MCQVGQGHPLFQCGDFPLFLAGCQTPGLPRCPICNGGAITLEFCMVTQHIKLPGFGEGDPCLCLSSQPSLTTRGQGSMAVPVALSQRRSARVNLGKNGRDVQLNWLGDQLAAPTRQKKRQFVPEGGLVLGNNALAPAKKKRRSKVSFLLLFSNFPFTGLTFQCQKSQHAEPQPQPSTAQPQPCQQLNDDGRFGFHPPFQQTVTPSTPMQPMSSHQSLHPPHISPPHLPCPSPPHPPDVSPPHPHFQVPRRSLFLDTVEPSDSEADEEAGGEDLEPEIDERSDDEDDRRAHAFLHASSNHVTMATLSQPAVSSVQGVTTTTSP